LGGSEQIQFEFLVVQGLALPCIAGVDFLRQYMVKLDYAEGSAIIQGRSYRMHSSKEGGGPRAFVALMEDVTMKSLSQGCVPAKLFLNGKDLGENCEVEVTPDKTLRERGIMVATSWGTVRNNCVPVMMMSANPEEVILKAGTVLGWADVPSGREMYAVNALIVKDEMKHENSWVCSSGNPRCEGSES
jgi:hypothetical protein